MALYGYKERFVPMIYDHSKEHTIRADRKDGRLPKPGEKIYMYVGLRTKNCYKIGEAECTGTAQIQITDKNIKIFNYDGNHIILVGQTADRLAWKDGFRPKGFTRFNGSGAFHMMIKFWIQTHGLPFTGRIIYWKDFEPATQTIIKKIKS